MHGWENLTREDLETILDGIESGEVLGGPYHVELDVVDICNVDCFFCGSADVRKGAVFTWDQLAPRIDEMVNGELRSFRLAGGGEPLIYPWFPELVGTMAQGGVVLDNLTTNGVRLLGKPLDALLGLKLSNAFISLNYCNEVQHRQFMGTARGGFDRIIAGVREYDRQLRKANRRDETLIHIQFMLHRSTLGNISEMMDLALDLPADSVVFRACHHRQEGEYIDDPKAIRKMKEDLLLVAERSRGKIWLEIDLRYIGEQLWALDVTGPLHGEGKPNPEDFLEKPKEIEYCYMGWYSMLAHGTGDVYPCCFLFPNHAIAPVGNLKVQSVQDVWNGDAYRRYREEMRHVMLMEHPGRNRHEQFTCTTENCRAHDKCLLAHSLADAPFYQEVHRRLQALRQAHWRQHEMYSA